jgi:two-component system sensor histidine kinase BarA
MLRWPVMQADWQPVLAALADGRDFAPSAGRDTSAAALPRFAGARVLVADDSAVNREVALESLARCGVTDVVAVEDGAAAVDAARAQCFDLILMDGSMPVLDGFSAAKAIRDHEAATGAPRTPIVALTAHVLGEAAEAAEASGMDGLLMKPFTLAQLAALLQRHAPSHGTGAAEPAAEAPAAPVAPQSGAEDELFDAEVLDGLLGLGDGAFVARIADLYRRQAPVALASLREAFAAGDQPGIAQAAHSLKSMSANIGATVLVARLRTIETAGREGRYAGPPGEGEALEALLCATILGLDARIGDLAAAA